MPAASRARAWSVSWAEIWVVRAKKARVEVWKAALWAAREAGLLLLVVDEGELDVDGAVEFVRARMALLALMRICGICALMVLSSWMRSAAVLGVGVSAMVLGEDRGLLVGGGKAHCLAQRAPIGDAEERVVLDKDSEDVELTRSFQEALT